MRKDVGWGGGSAAGAEEKKEKGRKRRRRRRRKKEIKRDVVSIRPSHSHPHKSIKVLTVVILAIQYLPFPHHMP